MSNLIRERARRRRLWITKMARYKRRLWCRAPEAVLCSETGPDSECGVPYLGCACAQIPGIPIPIPNPTGEGMIYVCPLCGNGDDGCAYQTTIKALRRRRPAAPTPAPASRFWAALDKFCSWRYAPVVVFGSYVFFWLAVAVVVTALIWKAVW